MSKVCFLTFADFGDYENYKTRLSLAILRALKRVDEDTEVVCRDYKNFNYKNKRKALPFGRIIPYMLAGIKRYIHDSFPSRFLVTKMIDNYNAKRIAKNHSLLYMIPPSYPKCSREMKKRGKISVLHGGIAHFNHNLGENENPSGKIAETIENSNYVLALSEWVKNTYVKEGYPSERIYVTPMGVDSRKFRPAKKKDNVFRIVCVGDYDKEKGFHHLLKAWEELQLKNSELVIVGTPLREMKKIVSEYQDKLDNLKLIPHTDPRKYYQQASVLVHPSLKDGWGKVVTEAMACGKPVITTEETGSKEAIREGKDGFIIKPKRVKELKEKILYFYNNPKKVEEMGKNARKRIEEEYTMKHYSDRVYKAMMDIVERENL